MSEPISYPVPWDQVASLGPHIARGTRRSVDEFSAGVVKRMQPPPELLGLENLPESPRFLLVANHYQRKGLWILHSASALTQAVRGRYGPGDPPVRWLVTANWPPVKIGPWKFASPGDWLLPKVAHALSCYPVSFAGSNPEFTARSLRQLLRDAKTVNRPIGLFPEGVAGAAGVLSPPLAGVEKLIVKLAKSGLPVVPAGISEAGRFVIRFGKPVPPVELIAARDAARLALERVGELMRPEEPATPES